MFIAIDTMRMLTPLGVKCVQLYRNIELLKEFEPSGIRN